MEKYKILLVLAFMLAVNATTLAFLAIFNLCKDKKCGGSQYHKDFFKPQPHHPPDPEAPKVLAFFAFHCLAILHGMITIILSAIPLCTKKGENRVGSFLLTFEHRLKFFVRLFWMSNCMFYVCKSRAVPSL